jgi:hypothetical protein
LAWKTNIKLKGGMIEMNKSIYLAFGAAMLLVLAAPFALAEDSAVAVNAGDASVTAAASDTLSGDAGTTPDSAMYGLKLGWERAKLWFTFKQEKKAEKELQLARLRLVEARIMAEKGNVKAFQRAQEAHNALIERAQARLAAIQEDTTEANIKENLKKVSWLEVAIEVHENRIAVLNEILAEKNLSEEAKTAIESAVARMENRTEAMKQKAEERKEKIKTRLKAVAELTDEEADEVIAGIDNSTGLTKAKKAIAEKRIERAENAVAKVEASIASGKIKMANSSALNARLAEAKADVSEAKAFVEAGNYDIAIETIKPVNNYGRVLRAEIHLRNEIRQEVANELREAKAEIKQDIKEKIVQARAKIRSEIAEKVKARVSASSKG